MPRPPGSKNFGGNQQGERQVVVHASLKPRARELLMAAAADQFRSLTGQAAKYVIDGLMRDGYIKPSDSGEVP